MYQWTVGVFGLQVGDRDELTLGQLDDIVAPVDNLDLIGFELGDDIAGLVVPVRVEHISRDLGTLEVAAEHRLGFDQQLTPRVWFVGGEVPQLGHVDQLVVDDGRALDSPIADDDPRLGGPVPVGDTGVQAGFDECREFFGQWR
ncbi:hypothetical protein CCUG60884_03804 [Mycobacteroides salmoniphilum]|uniref:Uncharacterized protein n=1 Tax=Mycobacteroides salmoniphilum TaxID=404941 RepID=A0A4R8SQD6_9MYCO|nr:hypothetical protein CCUG60884_03804 [Mycobacteroides salmoniphilum]